MKQVALPLTILRRAQALRLRRGVRSLAAFRRGEAGTISVETVLVLPLLIWVVLASITLTDAFRHQGNLVRSAHTVTDLASSSTRLRPSDIDGIFSFMLRINATHMPIRLRMSLIGWDADAEQLRVVWSNANHAGGAGALNDVTLNNQLAAHVPMITQGETLVLSEAWLDYTPPFRIGLPSMAFHEVAVMRPRFAPGVAYDDPNAPPPPPAWCEFIIDGCGM